MSGNQMTDTGEQQVSLEHKAFYNKVDAANCTPLWEVLHSLLTVKPNTPCLPYLWAWDMVWPWLQEGGQLITAKEAEGRVLVLENPGLCGQSCVTHSLYAGLQLILSGEVATAHRHSLSALRFILQGGGAYTTVNGEKVTLNVGDFVITQSWTFHDHSNFSNEPMVWLDGLDLPIVELLDAQFRQDGASDMQKVESSSGTCLARFGNTMKLMKYKARSRTSPLFWYPYDRTREALETLRDQDEAHVCWGYKLQYTNPITDRLGYSHHGHLHANAAFRIQGQALSVHRLHRLCGGGRPMPMPLRHQWASHGFWPQRCFCLPGLDALHAQGR